MKIEIPEMALVFLIGPSGTGKTTFARKHFSETEVVSSDHCRALVSDDENSLKATDDAFEVLNTIVEKRLKRGLLTVVDATNVQIEARKPLLDLAKKYHILPVAIVLELSEQIVRSRNEDREDRIIAKRVLKKQFSNLRKSVTKLKREGFRFIYRLPEIQQIEEANIIRKPLFPNKKHLTGPFDLIGDVHGCFDELKALLERMGYQIEAHPDLSKNFGFTVTPPEGRTAVFVGDIVDRGPKIVASLRLVMSMVHTGAALCVPGNHEAKLYRKLSGKNVKLKHGLEETMQELELEGPDFLEDIKEFIWGLVSHVVLDEGRLVVAHAGLREEMHGRASGAVRAFCLYGETTGEIDQFGLPVRYNWAAEYEGDAYVVYGHTPVPEAVWYNRTLDIDTGCVFGGKLTALRYPEMELVEVDALQTWCEPTRPISNTNAGPPQPIADDLPAFEDISGKQRIDTKLQSHILIKPEQSAAALEIMSRFAIDPKWLIHLPPTMSPVETSKRDEFLEHPHQAFSYYAQQQVQEVICQEKHMGSRALIIACRDEKAAAERFGVTDGKAGVIYSRTGRAFFQDDEMEKKLIGKVRTALDKSDFWKNHETNWVLLDCELMPWSAKAQKLLKTQYAAVGAAGTTSVSKLIEVLQKTAERGLDVTELLPKFQNKNEQLNKFVQAYGHYCWPVNSPKDYKIAPFHILATEKFVHVDKPHSWHMEEIAKICEAGDGLLMQTKFQVVNPADPDSVAKATAWWEDMVEKGGEGMVVKPMEFVTTSKRRRLLQPALKVRGPEYLRIIYGPEYDSPEVLAKLKHRNLRHKRSLALREFALGIQGLEHFVQGDGLRKVHRCVFGVLALESEPVDPRL